MAKIKGFRVEKDSLGEVLVLKMLYTGTNSRAVENFPISGIKMDFPSLIRL